MTFLALLPWKVKRLKKLSSDEGVGTMSGKGILFVCYIPWSRRLLEQSKMKSPSVLDQSLDESLGRQDLSDYACMAETSKRYGTKASVAVR